MHTVYFRKLADYGHEMRGIRGALSQQGRAAPGASERKLSKGKKNQARRLVSSSWQEATAKSTCVLGGESEMNIREVITSQTTREDMRVESDALLMPERLMPVPVDKPGDHLRIASEKLVAKGTLPFIQIHHQPSDDAFGRAVNCSHAKFMHTFFRNQSQEELITKSYLGGLALLGIGAAVTKFSPKVGQAMMLGGITSNLFGTLEGLRFLNGVNDDYSSPPNCKIFGGKTRL
jgi:hypothetical protein